MLARQRIQIDGVGHADVLVRLEQVRARIEDRFVRTGDLLAQSAGELGDAITTLDDLTGALNEGVLGAMADRLRNAAGRLALLPDLHAQRGPLLARLANDAARIERQVEVMLNAFRYLRASSVFLRIGAATVTAGQGDFGSLIDQIRTCLDEGDVLLAALMDNTASLQGAVAGAREGETRLMSDCMAMATKIPAALTRDADLVLSHQKAISASASELSKSSRRIQQQLGGVLASMQIGDSTRQRIEHVQTILDTLDRTSLSGLDSDQVDRFVRFVDVLAAELLASATTEFDSGAEAIEINLHGLVDEARAVSRIKDAVGGPDRSGSSTLLSLNTHVNAARQTIDDMDKSVRAAIELGEKASAIVAELSSRMDQVESIQSSVEHMVINTTLKSARLGDEGKALAVVANEVRLQGERVAAAAKEATAALVTLTVDARELTRNAASGTDESHSELLQSAAAEIFAVASRTDERMGALAGFDDMYAGRMRTSAAQLNLRGEFVDPLLDAVDDLSANDAGAAPDVADIAEPLSGFLASIAGLYTMSAEREIHARMAQQLGEAATAQPLHPPAMQADDDIFL